MIDELDRAIRGAARHFGVSQSWIYAFAAGQLFNVPIEDYRSPIAVKRKRKRAA